MKLRAALVLSCMASVAVGCRNLADVTSNECGNRVVERGETCDGEPDSCLPPGTAGQCHYDCALKTDGTRPLCPSGSGCDVGGVCREASGGYLPPRARVTDNATSVIAADFDGDGRAEVLSREALSVLGAKFRLHFFDRDLALTQSWISARPILSLAVGQVSGDTSSDVIFADERIGVLLGQPNHTLISETYASYFLTSVKIRVAGSASAGLVDMSVALVILTEDASGVQVRHPASETRVLEQSTTIPGASIDDLAGAPVTGDLFPGDGSDPCAETVIAIRGATEVHAFSLCERLEDGSIGWRKDAIDHVVRLEPPAAIENGPLLVDVDGDSHLDLVIGTESQAYVAYGDGQSLSAARPWNALIATSDAAGRTALPDTTSPIEMPLALGDFTGDGPSDMAYPSGLYISHRKPGGQPYYEFIGRRFGDPWTAARVADLNANGKLDVVAVTGTKLDIDFYNGTGTDFLNFAVIPTERPVRELAVGDFDGDLIDDLAYLETAAPSEPTEIMVSFGNAAGPPEPGVTAARASGVMQIGAVDFDPRDQAAELFVAYQQPNAQGVDGSSFAWLTGADRRMLCLVELTTFSQDGRLEQMAALSLVPGAFTGPGQRDALTFGIDGERDTFGLWLVPDLRDHTSQPRLLDFKFDPDVEPWRFSNVPGEVPELNILLAAGDFDADGVDELAIAEPNAARDRCNVTVVRLQPSDGSVQTTSAFWLETPCSSGDQLAVEDLDGDLKPEIVLLSGHPGETRSFEVFWNDGGGNFDPAESTELADGDDVPEAFAFYRPTQGERLRLATVTSDRLRVFQATDSGRAFERIANVKDVELEHGTGVAAGDVDGDGIADLVVADQGDVTVYRAQLNP